MGVVFKELILSLSGVTVGAGLYVGIRHARAWLQTRRRRSLHMAILRTSESVIIALIAEAVYRSPILPVTWRLWLYTIALGGCFDGFLYIARHRGEP